MSYKILEGWCIIMKREETNDIIQQLIPAIEKVGISKEYCKIDVTTEKSKNQRGDVWISTVKQGKKDFEDKIIALIEAKHRKCNIGDMDWRDAMYQGKQKATKQSLNYYIVTNCSSEIRYYNRYNDDEIKLDGKILTKLVSLDILIKIQSQVSIDNSEVTHKTKKANTDFTESTFLKSLKNLADIYRSAGLKSGDERIDPTVSFVVLKYISEKEKEYRTLNNVIPLWDDFRDIAYEKEKRDLSAEFKSTVDLIWGDKSAYKDNIYKDFKDLVKFPSNLTNEHFKKIYLELDKYHFHGGAKFDLFGSIYEEFASQTKKKEFGEFYTRRHITGLISRILLRNENNPRNLKICDPACGTGGFLTEAFKTLTSNYSINNKLNDTAIKDLRKNTFWGYDTDSKSVARTKLNMFLVGDGHTHIYQNDSLIDWNAKVGWTENSFDYILANPPMGEYKGSTKIENFNFTNEKRYELMFLEKIVDATTYGGEIAVVINDGALETPSRKNFRIELLKHCDINAIISLTSYEFAPYTKEKTYILIMQKKQKDKINEIQKYPIWNFIIDYDGYANSDKRYKTKYHDDLPELEEKFDGALKLARMYITDKEVFENSKHIYERLVNEREQEEGLWGYKYGYTLMEDVNESNFYNLLTEYHLRPYTTKQITIEDMDKQINQIVGDLKSIISGIS